jgi:hypothetical protein
MARKKAGTSSGESISGYFKSKFSERPELLKERSNDVLYQMWLADHPGHSEVPLNVKQGLSNIKSSLRGKAGKKRRGRRGRRARVAAVTNGEAPKVARVPTSVLEKLEMSIDECLTLARSAGADALHDVIRELRKARNAVVWKQSP